MARLVSLLLGGGLSLALLFLPAARGGGLSGAQHGAMSLLLLVICALFVHGSGFRFVRAWPRRLFSPWLLWPLGILSWMLFWTQR